MRCKEGKDCSSKCGDTEFFQLADQASNKCKHFESSSLATEGRSCYKLDQYPWICSNNHVVDGVEEGKQANPCPECKETLENHLNTYLTSRLATLGLDAENGVNRLFCKSGGVPGKISYNQFLRCLL